jgi:alkylhydroperoxidase family enzyme
MAYVRYVPEDEAGEDLRRLYGKYRRPDGGVDNILRIHGLNPPSLEHHVALYRHAMFGPSPLSRAQREMIAVVVSAANSCHY